MTADAATVAIVSRDYWFKVVGFDQILQQSQTEADERLLRNGFRRYSDDPQAQKMFGAPAAPFRRSEHPNGPIYSSGRFWN